MSLIRAESVFSVKDNLESSCCHLLSPVPASLIILTIADNKKRLLAPAQGAAQWLIVLICLLNSAPNKSILNTKCGSVNVGLQKCAATPLTLAN